MYIVSLTYHRPIAEVDSHLEGHIAWLKKYFQEGTFVASGRKNPRTGGVILAKGIERTRLDDILAEDPFSAVAHYEVTDFSATTTAVGFDALAGL
ncbi:YciI family protein [Serratia entomophila]|uniref:YciI family protein n=1 Tax=Serratia entomophila TaxID=42906 RepID=UPI00217CC0AA|nr:YciI family protein [Serratia entomophila]CAI0716481.1 YCII-related domain [Serratia entomophila]CAI0856558.1 YCII-related domain [Serratia entomophila]CAI1043745.1 YCII-related domain [Serratia entomophila]CAI1536625.1 YCII-related domain [Serratia entomophila]CAI1554406.1 YCII-related domain [Serratia entomophila]